MRSRKSIPFNIFSQPAAGAWALLVTFYLISVIFLWPGVMSPDASSQYSAAMEGVYSDHHPPLMSFVWRYLAQIYPGPAPMFMFHITMLYLAAAIFIYIFRESKFKWWYAIYPLLPNILAYTALIVKDTGFTFSYLLSGAVMALMCTNRIQKFRSAFLIPLLFLLFYGTAVKFQAKYLLIFFTIAVAYCFYNYKFNFKTISSGITLYLAILTGVLAINSYLVPTAQESHSWQWVKVYDLSGMSVRLNKPLYPEFILQQPNFDFEKVKVTFDPYKVDELVFPRDAVIRGGADQTQRQALWDYWFKTVLQHPWLYLQVRANLFKYNLITAPCENNNPVKFLQTTALAPILRIPGVSVSVDLAYDIFKVMLRFIWLLPLLAFYIFLGVAGFRKNNEAAPILLFTLCGTSLLGVLFFLSMAGTARYVFLTTCLLHASHGFAYAIFKKIGFRQLTRLNPISYIQTYKSPS